MLSSADASIVPANRPRTHFVYLVPSDKTEVGTIAIQKVAQHLQRWYRDHLGSGKTFTLTNPIVTVLHTNHTSTYYNNSTHFRSDVIADAAPLGVGMCQPDDDWLIYIDAEPGPNGGVAGGAGCYSCNYSTTPATCTEYDKGGIAVLGQHDLQAAMAISQDWTQCREYGGAGHELGHSFNLHHPIYTPWNNEIMGVGYTVYPNAILTNGDPNQYVPLGTVHYWDQPRLDTLRFFTVVPESELAPAFNCLTAPISGH
jgi:hypothetical protein